MYSLQNQLFPLLEIHVLINKYCYKVYMYMYNVYRPCAADVRRLNFPDIYRIMSGKRMVVSIAFSRKSALAIKCRQYVVQFQLGTTRLLRFIDFLLAVERTQQVMDSTTLYCIVSCHSKWRIRHIFPYISVLDDVTAQGLLYVLTSIMQYNYSLSNPT